ncbi:MAG: hypothetical protein JEY91_06620 [Spirochaetaceae bacterium]|nr:hypothetical protein [Spirochaetaceae bacterium]
MNKNRYVLISFLVLIFSHFNSFGYGIFDSENTQNYEYLITQADDSSYSERLAQSHNNRSDISFSSFSGGDTIALVSAQEGDEVQIEFITEITKGDFVLVFINSKDELQVLATQSEKGIKEFIPGSGLSRIKMAGTEADGSLHLRITGEAAIEYLRLGQDG